MEPNIESPRRPKCLVIAGNYAQFARYYEDNPDYKYVSSPEQILGYNKDIRFNYVGTFWENPIYGCIAHRIMDPWSFEMHKIIKRNKKKRSWLRKLVDRVLDTLGPWSTYNAT